MPLVVPGLNNPATDSADSKMDWQMKLLGKKLGDTSDETVRCILAIDLFSVYQMSHEQQTFSRKELPKDHRIVEEGSMTAQDHNPDR